MRSDRICSTMWLLFLLFGIASAQLNCNTAPNAALRLVCSQLSNWDRGARSMPAAGPGWKSILRPGIAGAVKQITNQFGQIQTVTEAPKSASQVAAAVNTRTVAAISTADTATDIYQCLDIPCMCRFFPTTTTSSNGCTLRTGVQLRKGVRKEYRMMTDAERNRFHTAMWTIKTNGDFGTLMRVHSNVMNAASAHGGPAFMGWHREFVKRIEFALRKVDPTVTVPYWDSTLDANLADPRDSCLWTNELMGTTNPQNFVVTGAFRGWSTSRVQSVNNIYDMLAYTTPQAGCPRPAKWDCLEYIHGYVHVWVGGDMLDLTTSANDPIFYLHHSFVDLIWEQWRQRWQTRATRETQYPASDPRCLSTQHYYNSDMRPFFPFDNMDALSNKYTDNLYSYAPRPTCALGADCGSRFLFCDRSHGTPRCAAKIKVGGVCTGYTQGESVCYLSVCQGGRCVSTAVQPTTQPPIVTTAPAAPPTETCFNEHECCGPWAALGQCAANPGYMSVWCQASCGQCRPTTYSLYTECSNRHPMCAQWAQSGECSRNAQWMSENCRQSCAKCGATRAQVCGSSQQATTAAPTTTTTAPATTCASPGCYNENVCCHYWASYLNYCTRSPTYMNCSCRVACGRCRPTNFTPNSCADYDRSCAAWARAGECNVNAWMRENCRVSCGTCLSFAGLQSRCGTSRRAPLLRKSALSAPRPTPPPARGPPAISLAATAETTLLAPPKDTDGKSLRDRARNRVHREETAEKEKERVEKPSKKTAARKGRSDGEHTHNTFM